MGYTFDGPNRRIILTPGTTSLDVADMYSRWIDWLLTGDNSKFLFAMRSVGGDPTVGSDALGVTFFMMNNWKIRPQEDNHRLIVSGNLYADDGSDPFTDTLGTYNVRVMQKVSNLIDKVATGGGVGTVEQVAAAVWEDSPTGAQVAVDADFAANAAISAAEEAVAAREAAVLARQARTNRDELVAGSTDNYKLYGDDGETVIGTQDVTDSGGGPVVLPPGVPARRSAFKVV